MSGTWRHLKCKRQEPGADTEKFVAKECARQELLEGAKYRSPTWQVLRALKGEHTARQLYGETAITAPPFFEAACAGDTMFCGEAKGPMVVLWDSLDDMAKAKCEEQLSRSTNWVVWSREKKPRDATDTRPFERLGRQIFCGKAKLANASASDNDDEQQASKGRALRCKGWWKTGALDTCNNLHNMACWVHCNSLEVPKSSIDDLRAAWESIEDKNECEVTLEGPDRDYWLGSEIGMLGGYAFKGVTMGIDGSNGEGRMGAGCCCFKQPEVDRWVRVGREDEGTSSNRPELGGLLLSRQPLRPTISLWPATTKQS